jgi:diguanylate cyclase (GGDEF)-like protein/PAS domain S-box-containing protein
MAMDESSQQPETEDLRIQDLYSYEILDTLPESDFDALTRLAKLACRTPIAFISFIDQDRQWFKSAIGWEITETERSQAFCHHTILQRDVFIVADARTDPRFKDNPLVTCAKGIAFYAGAPILSSKGNALGTVGVIDHQPKNMSTEEIAALKTIAAEAALHLAYRKEQILAKRKAMLHHESERKFRVLLENLPGMAYRCLYDDHWTIQFVSKGALKLTGYSSEEMVSGQGFHFADLILPEDRKAVQQAVEEAIHRNQPFQMVYRLRKRNGDLRWVWEQGCAIRDDQGEILALEGFLSDITEHKQNEQLIEFIAYHDTLTGLPNRGFLNDSLTMLVSSFPYKQEQFALLFIDLDYFKYINDTLGHTVGDCLLQSVANRLKDCLRATDTLCRLGGDEFIALLPATLPEDAGHVASKILNAFDDPFTVGEKTIVTQASIGISSFPNDGKDGNELIQSADIAMYKAKESGRKNYQFFTPELGEKISRISNTYSDLRQAIRNQELFLHYQPQIDLTTGLICGIEALLRWLHPTKGLISPANFIPIAEENGQIIPIGKWVIEAACKQLAAWRKDIRLNVPISVNVSTRQLNEPGLVQYIQEKLGTCGLKPEDLELEITEGVMLSDSPVVTSFFDAMDHLGVKLAIDDFGTGYSSLSYLKKLPVSRLKIDQSFIRDIGIDDNDDAVIKSIIGLAHQFKMKVIAEGLETEAQLDFLRAHGCDEGQGYLISKPIPPEALEALVNSRTQWLSSKESAKKD